MRTKLIFVLWLVVVSAMGAAVALRLTGILSGDTLDFVGGLAGLAVTTSTLGALILRRHVAHRVGELFFGLAISYAVVVWMRLVATSFDPPSTRSGVIGLVEEALRIWGIGGMAVLILIYPTGRLLSRRWRWAAVLAFVGTTLGWFQQLFVPGVIDGIPPVVNPIASRATAPIARALEPAGVFAPVIFGIVIVSVVLRYRRSTTVEREQIKLFALSVIGVIVLIAGTTAAFPKQVNNGLLGSLVWQSIWIFPPTAAAYAILRRGLFDIDRVISRTLSYAIVTIVLGGLFALVALGIPTLFLSVVRGQTSGAVRGNSPSWLIAAATLVVAALARPLLRRVQARVDHRFNRGHYDAEHTIDTFTARLREEIDIDALGAELVGVIEATMQPRHVSLWTVHRS